MIHWDGKPLSDPVTCQLLSVVDSSTREHLKYGLGRLGSKFRPIGTNSGAWTSQTNYQARGYCCSREDSMISSNSIRLGREVSGVPFQSSAPNSLTRPLASAGEFPRIFVVSIGRLDHSRVCAG